MSLNPLRTGCPCPACQRHRADLAELLQLRKALASAEARIAELEAEARHLGPTPVGSS